MDEQTVRAHARAHGDAVLAGDLRGAAADLRDDAKRQAPGVMAQLPDPITNVEVSDVRAVGRRYEAIITYRGNDVSTAVASRWEERDGRPVIVELEVVEGDAGGRRPA